MRFLCFISRITFYVFKRTISTKKFFYNTSLRMIFSEKFHECMWIINLLGDSPHPIKILIFKDTLKEQQKK